MSRSGEEKKTHQEPQTLDLDNLPCDLSLLHQLIRDLVNSLQGQQSDNEKLRHRLDQLLRVRFGSKSERFEALDWQSLLFEELRNSRGEDEDAQQEKDSLLDTDENDTPPATNGKEKTKKKGHGRKPFPEHLPRQRVEFPLPEEKCECPNCAGHLEKIGEEVTQQLEYVPASFFVKELVRFKYACKKCQEGVTLTDFPPQPIEKGIPGPGLLAQVITAKYSDHLPLNRQSGIYLRSGVDLPRQTLCDWSGKMGLLLQPLGRAQRKDLLASKKIHTDDTIIPVLDDSLKKTKKGRMWVYGNNKHIVYDYTPDRSREGPIKFLKGYRGYIQADAYAGYNELYGEKKATKVGCWAHARRKFVEAKDHDPARSHTAVVFIKELYRIEHECRDLDAETRASLRQSEALPVLKKFKAWLIAEYARVLPQSPVGKAIAYTLNQWKALVVYTQDGDLDPDNNFAEREMRRVVLGRKNFLFCGSDNGGKSAATIYSLVATCKLHGIDPFVYFRDVLEKLPTHPINQIEDLLPHNWKKAAHASSVA